MLCILGPYSVSNPKETRNLGCDIDDDDVARDRRTAMTTSQHRLSRKRLVLQYGQMFDHICPEAGDSRGGLKQDELSVRLDIEPYPVSVGNVKTG